MSSTIIINCYQKKLQVDEKFRIDCSNSFVHPGGHSIQSMTVEVEASGDTFTITSDKILDYAYSTAGTKVITVTIVHSDSSLANITKTKTIEVVTAASEKLFSDDPDIISLEPDILSYLPDYKADYKYAHRISQDTIVKWLDENGLVDNAGNKLTAASLVNVEEVRLWSKYLTLSYIFQSLSNAIDDFFSVKSSYYRDLAEKASQRTYISLDMDGDGDVDVKVGLHTGGLFR